MPDELATALSAVNQSLAALQQTTAALHSGQAGLIAEQRAMNDHLQRLSQRFYSYCDDHESQHRTEEQKSRERGQANERRITRLEADVRARTVIGSIGLALSWIFGQHLPPLGPKP